MYQSLPHIGVHSSPRVEEETGEPNKSQEIISKARGKQQPKKVSLSTGALYSCFRCYMVANFFLVLKNSGIAQR